MRDPREKNGLIILIIAIIIALIAITLSVLEVVAQFKYDGVYIEWRWISIAYAFK